MAIAMTVTDIFVRVVRTFGDEAAVQVEFADVIRWINDAQREAVMQHEGLLTTDLLMSTVAGQAEYVIPDDIFALSSISFRPTPSDSYYPLRWIPLSMLNEMADGWDGPAFGSGTPQVFTKDTGSTFTLIPTPSTTISNAMRILYSRYPNDVIDDTSTIDLPPYYHSYVEHFCMMKAYEKDEDWESADRKAQLIQSTLDFNNNRESWFGRETYPTITTRVEDMD
jgi:hypothetical protein